MIAYTTPVIASRQTQEPSRLRSLSEVAIAFGLVEAALWSTRHAQGVWALLAALWVTFTTLRSRRTAEQLGITATGLPRSLWLVPAAMALSGLIVLAAFRAGTLHILTGAHTPPWHAALYAVWALAQEFFLLSFIFVRLEAALGGRGALSWTSFLFAIAHVPSPVLMATSFLLGLALTALFRRYRNIYPLALAHALLGLTIAISIPPGLTHNMRVGIAWWVR